MLFNQRQIESFHESLLKKYTFSLILGGISDAENAFTTESCKVTVVRMLSFQHFGPLNAFFML